MKCENIQNPGEQKNIPGFEEHEKKYTIEEAISRIDGVLDSVEEVFSQRYGRTMNLFDESDYVKMGNLLDLDRITQESMDAYHKGKQPLPFSSSQYCFRLMRRFFERENLFSGENQKIYFDAFLGRTEGGRNPKRERDMRLAAVDQLKRLSLPFPSDDFERLKQGLEKISEVALISGVHSDEDRRTARRVSEAMVNPSGYTKRRLDGIVSYDDLSKKIYDSEYLFDKNLNFVDFK